MRARPMQTGDLPEVIALTDAALADLMRRQGEAAPADDPGRPAWVQDRFSSLLEHDRAGCWVVELDGRPEAAAMALRRDGMWGLSLLMVRPEAQSRGLGRAALEASLRYADGCDRAVIMSSSDPRAIRCYAAAGFALHPALAAHGVPAAVQAAPGLDQVRPGGADDLGLAERVDRLARGAGHGPYHAVLARHARLLVLDGPAGQGYAYARRQGGLVQLAATTEPAARLLLWRVLAEDAAAGRDSRVQNLTAEQDWAIRVAVRAGLVVEPSGPMCWRGGTAPGYYLPSGAFL